MKISLLIIFPILLFACNNMEKKNSEKPVTKTKINQKQRDSVIDINSNDKDDNDTLDLSKLNGKTIIYFKDDAHDSISTILGRNNKCFSQTLKTFRDYNALLNYFKLKFGIPKNKPGVFHDDSLNNKGKFRWNHINSFCAKDLELTLQIEGIDCTTITFTVWSEKLDSITNKKELSGFFLNACSDYLFNQKDISKSKKHCRYFSDYTNFSDVIKLNYDSLVHVFEKFIYVTDDMVSIKVRIDKRGEVESMDITANNELKQILQNFIKNINFPVIVYKDSKNIIEYYLTWDFWISDDTFIKWAKAQLLKGTKNYLSTGFNDWTFYLSYGDFFNTGKKIYLVRNPHGKGVYFFDLKNGELQELYHDTDTDNDFYVNMLSLDMNNDSLYELVLKSHWNMNGNCWMKVYAMDKATGKIYHAGYYSTNENINKVKKEVTIDYGGSWYMPLIRKVLVWEKGKLVTKKYAVISLKDCDMSGEDKSILEYYENPCYQQGIDSLVLLKSDWSPGKYDELWYNFFK